MVEGNYFKTCIELNFHIFRQNRFFDLQKKILNKFMSSITNSGCSIYLAIKIGQAENK